MCDYSLEHVASRPARVADRLVSTTFTGSITGGFAAEDDVNTAICLRPGTEIAFDRPVVHLNDMHVPQRLDARVARFRQVNVHEPYAHHDALEFPDGTIVMLTRLVRGQRASVLQMPAHPIPAQHLHAHDAHVHAEDSLRPAPAATDVAPAPPRRTWALFRG